MNRGGSVVAADELVDHLTFGDANVAERNRKAEFLDEEFHLRLAEADFADEGMIAAIAALRRIGEAKQKALVAARQRLQPRLAPGREGERVARDVGDFCLGLRKALALDQIVARDEIADARGRRFIGRCCRGRRRVQSGASRSKSIRRCV